MFRRRAGGFLFAIGLSLLPLSAFGQAAETGGPAQATPNPSPRTRIWVALRDEGKRYLADFGAFVRAPLSWTSEDVQKGIAIGLTIGGLMLVDEPLDREFQRQRSAFTDQVSSSTTRFGGRDGLYLSAGLLAGGVIFKSDRTRDMGREALEAALLSHLLSKYVLKPAFGRKRPEDSGGETSFHPFSQHSSFPSGHATQAFAVASVVAARSEGWVIPTLAYGTASLVALDRVNDRAHFVSDVVAGAVLGTVTGRFLVARHRKEGEPKSLVVVDVVPIPDGFALQIRF